MAVSTSEYTIDIVVTDSTADFTDALAVDAQEEENISFHTDWATCQIDKVEILNVSLQSEQNLWWELHLYNRDTQGDTDLDIDTHVTKFTFLQSDGRQSAGSGQWLYDLDPAVFPVSYVDLDNTSEYHLTLINKGPIAKLAGASGGAVKITITARPLL